MKKLFSILLVLCVIPSLSACNNEVPATDINSSSTESSSAISDSTDSGNNIENETQPEKSNIEHFIEYASSGLGELYILPESEKEFLSHVVDYCRCSKHTHDIVITDDGSTYYFSLGKKFSNDTHHMKIDTDIKFVKVLCGCFVSSDNKSYEYDDKTKTFEQVYFSEKVLGDSRNESLTNIFKADGKLYKIDGNNVYSFEDECIIHSFPTEETIQFVYDGTIKTNGGYYQVGEIRIVSEYVDVEDTYEVKVIPCSLPFDCNYIKFDNLVFEEVEPAIMVVDNYIYMSFPYVWVPPANNWEVLNTVDD